MICRILDVAADAVGELSPLVYFPVAHGTDELEDWLFMDDAFRNIGKLKPSPTNSTKSQCLSAFLFLEEISMHDICYIRS